MPFMAFGGGALPAAAYQFELNWAGMLRDMRQHFSENTAKELRDTVHQTAVEATQEIVYATKAIIKDEADESGRLAAGFGIYDPAFLNPGFESESSPADAVYTEMTRGNQYYFEVGTTVEYAEAVMEGFTVSQERVVYIPSQQRFITVRPFSFRGVHALERAMLQVEVDGSLDRVYNRNMRRFERYWNRRARSN